jgi:hypothetical protein
MLDRIAWTSAALMIAGWVAVVYTAVLFNPGHPSLPAAVGLCAICASWALGPLGALCGAIAQSTQGRSPARGMAVNVDLALTLIAAAAFFL